MCEGKGAAARFTCLRKAGSERSRSHSHELTNRNRIPGLARWLRWPRPGRPVTAKPAWGRCGRCGARARGLIRGELLCCAEMDYPASNGRGREGSSQPRPPDAHSYVNRRMRTRLSGGVGGGAGDDSPSPIRSPSSGRPEVSEHLIRSAIEGGEANCGRGKARRGRRSSRGVSWPLRGSEGRAPTDRASPPPWSSVTSLLTLTGQEGHARIRGGEMRPAGEGAEKDRQGEAPSSRGLGRRPFKPETGIRIPLGLPGVGGPGEGAAGMGP